MYGCLEVWETSCAEVIIDDEVKGKWSLAIRDAVVHAVERKDAVGGRTDIGGLIPRVFPNGRG